MFSPVLLITGFVVLLALLALVRRPVLGAWVILSFAFVNPALVPPVVNIGEFTVRWMDIMSVILAATLLIRIFVTRTVATMDVWWKWFGPLIGLLIYIGLSLLWVWLKTPELFLMSLASFLRLMTTLMLGLFIYVSLLTEKEVLLLHHLLLVSMIATLAVGLWEAGQIGLMKTRVGGLLGINSFGLVSGLLALYGAVLWQVQKGIVPLCLIGIGLIGLVGSKSASSITATAVTLMLLWISRRYRMRSRHSRFPRAAVALVFGLLLGISGVWLLRQEDVEGLLSLSGGSFAQRLIIAYAALRIFLSDPILGTGWQASGTSFYIGDPNLNTTLMSIFSNLPSHYFFVDKPTSVHNMYLQLLTELGIIGFTIFIWTVRSTYLQVRRLLFDLKGSPWSPWASFMSLALVYLLIWWNTNPLYGGQTESLLAVSFLSILAAIHRLGLRLHAIKQEMSTGAKTLTA